MDFNLFKQYLDRKIETGANIREPFKQGEKLMELLESGSKEEQKKLAHTLLEMMRDKNR